MSSQNRALLFAPRRRLLDGEIADGTIKFGQLARSEIKDLRCQAARSRAGFDGKEFLRAAEHIPHLGELPRQQAAKNRVNVYAGVEIAETPAFQFAVVTKLRMIEALAHILGERYWPSSANALGKQPRKRRRECRFGACFRRTRFQGSLLCGLLINISIT